MSESEHRPGKRRAARECNAARSDHGQPATAKDYGQPIAYLFKKQLKSFTLRMGAIVEASQLAEGSPAAYLFRKHEKSLTLRMGAIVEASQLA